MNFASDNWSGAAPEISEALNKHSIGVAMAYGDGELDRRIEQKFADIFEQECAVFFVGTGTAANSLAAAAVAKPGGVVFCQSEAHLAANEGGAPQFLTSGGRMAPVSGQDGKMSASSLAKRIAQFPSHFNHLGQGTLVSITQSTEAGTVYSLDEIGAIGAVANAAGLPLHLDGARFANGLVRLGCSPAEMTWKQGVDMVSFGGTKNGCWCAEALLVFGETMIENFKFHRKRMGHLFSKTRFISAQFEAYLEDDLWLRLAQHSNSIGEKLEEAIRSSNKVRLAWPSQSNQVFFITKRSIGEKMLAQGANFYPFATPETLKGTLMEDEQVYRLVTSFSSTDEDVASFRALL